MQICKHFKLFTEIFVLRGNSVWEILKTVWCYYLILEGNDTWIHTSSLPNSNWVKSQQPSWLALNFKNWRLKWWNDASPSVLKTGNTHRTIVRGHQGGSDPLLQHSARLMRSFQAVSWAESENQPSYVVIITDAASCFFWFKLLQFTFQIMTFQKVLGVSWRGQVEVYVH